MDFPYGDIGSIPEDFSPPEAWPEFIHAAMPRGVCRRAALKGPPPGVRWSLWPITFEEYVGDREPDIVAGKNAPLARTRFVMWKRAHRTDAPKGWLTLSRRPWRVDGYVEMKPGEDFTRGWYKQARRDLRLWQEQHLGRGYAIEEISIGEYREAFARSTVNRAVGRDPLGIVERKYANPVGRAHMRLWGVRNTHSGAIIAGLSARYSPAANSATYESPFILPEARAVYAMTGLMEHWFALEAARGTKYLVFNSFWQPGEPKSWKPFSLFKSHFGPAYVAYPPTLWKFVPGKIF